MTTASSTIRNPKKPTRHNVSTTIWQPVSIEPLEPRQFCRRILGLTDEGAIAEYERWGVKQTYIAILAYYLGLSKRTIEDWCDDTGKNLDESLDFPKMPNRYKFHLAAYAIAILEQPKRKTGKSKTR